MATITDSAETASESIELALPWLRVGPGEITHPVVRNRDIERLAETGRFPAENHFTEILAATGLASLVDPKTLATAVSRYLATAKSFEEETGIEDAIFSNVEILPSLSSNFDNVSRVDIEESLCSAGLAKFRYNKTMHYASCRSGPISHNFRVECDIDAVQDKSGIEYDCGRLSTELVVLTKPDNFINALNAAEVWQMAEDSAELEIAIELQARSLVALNGSVGVPPFRVGTEFMGAIRRAQAAGSGQFSSVTLSRCAQVLIAPGSANARPFRTSSSANAEARIRERDGATAMRSHITGGHAALRLMYWQHQCGLIEFSTVRSKFDTEIDEGDALFERKW
ncbi:MAG: hypothetical protein ABIV36_21915 [Sphingobium limneticum]